MAAAEMYDYLSTISADYSSTFPLTCTEAVPELIAGQDKILRAYDASEERLSFATNPEFAMVLKFEHLSAADAGTIFDWYCDTAKAYRTTRTFKWTHPTDGHTYVVRFDDSMERVIRMGALMGISEIRFRVLGRIADA